MVDRRSVNRNKLVIDLAEGRDVCVSRAHDADILLVFSTTTLMGEPCPLHHSTSRYTPFSRNFFEFDSHSMTSPLTLPCHGQSSRRHRAPRLT